MSDKFIDQTEIQLALARDREMDEDPAKVITLEELDHLVANRRPAA